MKRIALLLLLCLCAVALGGVATRAATQPPAAPAHPPGPATKSGPLENGPAVPPAPFLTGPPSAQVLNDPHWRANVRANTDTTGTQFAQQEPAIGINPLNHNNIVAAQKDERRAPGPNTATKEVWIDTSTDGGVTWINTFIPMPDATLPQQSDPVITFSDDNNVFVTIIGYNQNNPTNSNLVLVARSSDGGLTWSPAVKVDPGLGGSDKEWTAIDLTPSSPYYHRLYVTWTNFAAGPNFIEKWSSDYGATWNPTPGTNYVTVSFGGFDSGQFSMPVVLPNGNVIATWNPGGGIAVGKSTDGGQSFINPNTQAVAITSVNSVPGSNWRLNTIPATTVSTATGTLVTVWADGRNGKDDIYYTRSTNGGTTWSAAARVAHNTAGSSYQVEPWVSVAPNGRFDVIWYDDRNFPSNFNTFDIYATHSTDDGATWTGPDEQVTDASTNLNIGIPGGPGWNGAAGDYIGVASVNEAAYGIWTDTRSGTNEDVYTSLYQPVQGTPTPTVTGTPPTATPTRTSTITPTVTQTPCSSSTIQNGGFETGTLAPWVVLGTNPAPVVSNALPHSGTYAALLGTLSGGEPTGDGSIYQTITVPASGGTLSYWWNGSTTDTINFDWQDAYITDTSGTILATIMHNCQTTGAYVQQTFNMTPYAGQTVRVEFLVHQDGFGDDTSMYVDDVTLLTACGTATITPSPVASSPTATATATAAASTATRTSTPIAATGTPVAGTSTATAIPPTGTAVPPTTTTFPATSTPVRPTNTVVPPTATTTPCTITFSDVAPTDYFYIPVQYLYCHGVISGYADNTFRPYANTTRSQMVKIVVLGFQKPVGTPAAGGYTFTDVPPANPFYGYIETAAALNIVSGYNCGGPGEPCDAQNRPYFRPYANVTRGQLSKIDVVAAGWALLNPATPTFTDVLPGTAFYTFVETAAAHGIISGYTCGGPGEPCDAQNRPYFRQYNDATRGQIAKIVYLSITSGPAAPIK